MPWPRSATCSGRRRMRATARLPDGRQLELIRIDDWDFNWQDQYRYVEPVALPRGTVVETSRLVSVWWTRWTRHSMGTLCIITWIA